MHRGRNGKGTGWFRPNLGKSDAADRHHRACGQRLHEEREKWDGISAQYAANILLMRRIAHNHRMNSGDHTYIWQAGDWPKWRYDLAALAGPLAEVSRAQGAPCRRWHDRTRPS